MATDPAIQNIIDNLGRIVPAMNLTLQEIQALVQASKTSATQPAAQPVDTSKLESLMSEFVSNFKDTADEQKKMLNDVVDAMKKVKTEQRAASSAARSSGAGGGGGGGKGAEKIRKKELREIEELEKAIGKTYNEEQRRRLNLAVKDYGQRNSMVREHVLSQAKINKGVLEQLEALSNSADVASQLAAEMTKNSRAAQQLKYQLMEVQGLLNKFEDVTGLETTKSLFGDIYKQEMKFTQEIRAAAYETAGVTKGSRSLQKAYEDIGKTVAETGVNRTKFQESYLKALRSGVKDLKQATSITKTQLNTEKQLGLEAGSLQETFQSYAMSGRMSNNQIAEMGRGMRTVAKTTGLTGDALRGAVDASKDLVDTLRKTANLTTSAANNVLELTANAKKLGIENEMQPLLKALSSSNALLFESSQETQALIFLAAGKAGVMDKVLNGTLLKTKDGVKQLRKGFDGILKDFGLNSREEIDNLDDYTRNQLNMAVKATLGVELGAFAAQYDVLTESSKTAGDKIADINKKLSQNITLEEKKGLLEEKRALKVGTTLSALTALDEAAKGAKDINQALSKFGKRKGEFEQDMASLGMSWTSETDAARKAIVGSLEGVNEGLKAAGKQELKIDSSRIEAALRDPTTLRELTAEINAGEQALATAQKAQLDPVTETNQKLTEINDTLRGISQGAISKVFNSILGKIIVFGGVLAGVGAGIIKMVGELMAIHKTIRSLVFGDKEGYSETAPLLQNLKDVLFGGGKKSPPPAPGMPPGTPASPAAAAAKIDPFLAAGLKSDGSVLGTPKPEAKKPVEEVTKPKGTEIFQKMLAALQAIEKCVCAEKSGGAAAQEEKAAAIDKKLQAKEVKESKVETKNLKVETVNNKKEGKNILEEAGNNKKSELEAKAAKASLPASMTTPAPAALPAPSAPAMPPVEVPKDESSGIKKLADYMKKNGAAIALLAAGALMLGTAVIYLGDKVLKALDLDAGRVAEVGITIGAVAAAGAAIAMAGAAAFEALGSKEVQEFVGRSQTSIGDVAKAALAIGIMGPALVLLGAAIVGLSGWIVGAFGLDASSAITIAASIGAVAGVAAGIGKAVGEFIVILDELNKAPGWERVLNNPGQLAMTIAKASLALLIAAPAIVILGAALLKATGWILGLMGMNTESAIQTAKVVAAIIASVAVIGISLVAALGSMAILGALLPTAQFYAPLMLAGAVALAILTPAILLLGAGLIHLTSKMSKLLGLNPDMAADTASAMSSIIWSAASIATSVLAGYTALTALGALGLIAFMAAPLLAVGALALSALMPGMMALSAAIIYGASFLNSFIDPKMAEETGSAMASILGAASTITKTIIGMSFELAMLGVLAAVAVSSAPLLVAGALGLVILMPALMLFTGAVIGLSNLFRKSMLKPEQAEEIKNGLGAILKAASEIASSVMSMVPTLAVLGASFLAVVSSLPLMLFSGLTLRAMILPLSVFVNSVLAVANSMGKILQPKDTKAVTEGFAAIMQAASSVASSIMSMIPKLNFLGGSFLLVMASWPLMMFAGLTLRAMIPPLAFFTSGVVAVAQAIGARLDPKKTGELVKGFAAIMESATSVADSIMKMSARMMAIGGGFILALAMWPQMILAGTTLRVLAHPIAVFIGALAYVAKKIGERVNPKQAPELAKGISEIFGAVGTAMEQFTKAKDAILQFAGANGFFRTLLYTVPTMWLGVLTFNAIAWPMTSYIKSIVDFAGKVGRVVNPKMAVSMAKGIAELMGAVGDVQAEFNKMKDNLIGIAKSEGIFKLFLYTLPMLWWGRKVFDMMAPALVKYTASIVAFANMIAGTVSPTEGKRLSKYLTAISGVIEKTAKVMDDMVKKIAPMTQSGWFSDSPINTLMKGRQQLMAFFPALVGFLSMIVSQVLGNFRNITDLKTTAKAMYLISMIIGQTGDAIKIMGEKIQPFTEKGWWSGKSVIDKLNQSRPQLYNFFIALVDLVNLGIVDPVMNKIGNLTQLKTAAKAMYLVGYIMNQVATAIQALAAVVGLMDDGLFTTAPINKIIKNKDKFAQQFGAIALFVQDGVVKPIMTELPNPSQLKAATPVMAALGTVMCGVGRTIKGLSEMMGLMDDGIFTDSPMTKIMKNKKQFSAWFTSVAIFVRDGIVGPVNNNLKVSNLILASNIIVAMAKVATSLPPMIKGLAEAVALATDAPSFFADAPMSKIIKSKDTFAQYFRQIAIFMRDGIVIPVMEEMDGVNISAAASVMRSMMSIVSTVGPMIKGLAGVVGLMSEDASTAIDTDFPLDKIVAMRDTFSDFFRKTAIFLREGIVMPILGEMPEPGMILKAGQILGAMANVIGVIPQVIRGVTEGLIPLVEAPLKNPIMDTAKEKIDESAETFSKFFLSTVVLLRDGIILPIVGEMPETGLILKAGQIMGATTNVIGTLKQTILALASLIGPLNSSDCLKEAPVNMIGRSVGEYAYWFGATFGLMRYGIVDPILNLMPDAKVVKEVKQRLDGMMQVMSGVSPLIATMVEMFGVYDPNKTFEAGPVSMIGIMAKLFTQYFTNVAKFLRKGIIEPIMMYLPESSQIEAVFYKLANMYKILRIIPRYLENVVVALAPLNTKGMFKDSSIAVIMNSTKYFTEWFVGLAKFFYFGIIGPMMNYFPNEKEMLAALNKLDNMQAILGRLPDYMDSIVQSLEPLNPKELEGMAPIRQIMESADTYEKWFVNLAAFMWNGIAGPITYFFPEEKLMIDALNKLDNMETILQRLPGYMEKVVKAFELLNPKEMLGVAPIRMVMMAVDDYEVWMKGLAAFLWNGVVNPIINFFPEKKLMIDAVRKLDNMETILQRLPGYMEKVVKAFELLNPKEMLGVAPIRMVMMAVDDYEVWMKGLAAFLWNGVVNPIINFFPEEKLMIDAVRKLDNMERILQRLPGYMEKVVKAFELLNPKEMLGVAPIRMVMMAVDDYEVWMKGLAAFLWNGVVNPIINFFPEESHVGDAIKKLDNMETILQRLPGYMEKVVKAFELLNPKEMLGVAPIRVVMMAVTEYEGWMKALAAFLWNGVTNPILTYLPDKEHVETALAKIENMNSILDVMPEYINKAVGFMKVLDPRDLLAEQPLNTLKANYEIYRTWLQALGAFMWNGIILSIEDYLPEPGDGKKSLQKLQTTSAIMEIMPGTVISLSKTLGAISGLTEVFGAEAGMTRLIKGTSTMAFAISKGIVEPLNNLLPDDSELLSVLRKLEITSLILADISDALNAMNMEMMGAMSVQAASSDMVLGFENKVGIYGIEGIQENFAGASIEAQKQIDKVGLSITDVFMSVSGVMFDLLPSFHKELIQFSFFLGESLFNAASSILDIPMLAIKGFLSIGSFMTDTITGIYTDIMNFGTLISDSVFGAIMSILDLPNKAIQVLKGFGSFVTGMLTGIFSQVTGFISWITDSIFGTAQAILDLPNKILEGIKGIGSSITSWLFGSKAPAEAEKTFKKEDVNTDEPRMSTARQASDEAIRSKISAKRVMEEPQQAQVSGKELNEIADESSTQTELQRKLVELFTQVLNELKPKSSPVTASGGMFGNTKPNEVANRPAKYFRNPSGSFAQNPGKAVVNLGPPRV